MIWIFLIGYVLPVVLSIVLAICDEVYVKDIFSDWVLILFPCANAIVCVLLIIAFIGDNLQKIKVYTKAKDYVVFKWEKFINYKIK